MAKDTIDNKTSQKVMHNRGIVAPLEKLGLSKNEIKCYLGSLSIGSAAVQDVAKAAGINRVNAYGAVRMLAERGLLEQEMTKRGQRVHPAPIERLQEFAQQHQKQATRLRWKIEDVIPQLMTLSSQTSSPSIPSAVMGAVSFYRGDDAFYRIAERTLQYAPPGSTIDFLESFDYFHLPDYPTYDDEYYIPKRMELDIAVRVLHYPDEFARQLRLRDTRENRETRFLPSDINFPCSIYIYGNEAALLWTVEHVIGITIHGGPLVALLKTIFEMIWQMERVVRVKKTK